MKTRIMLTLTKAEYFDSGHEIERLAMLAGTTIRAVDEHGGKQVIITVEDSPPRKQQNPATSSQQRKGKTKRRCDNCISWKRGYCCSKHSLVCYGHSQWIPCLASSIA